MSFLGGLLDIVGVAAALWTGGASLGLLGGALIGVGALAAASQFGIIGGSVGKFMSSGWGSALVGAVSLGVAAYSQFGQGILQSGQVGAQQTVQASAAESGMGEGGAFASGPVATPAMFGNSTGTSQLAANMTLGQDGLPAQSINAVNSAANPAETTAATQESAGSAGQAASAATQQDVAATQPTSATSSGAPTSSPLNAAQEAVKTVPPPGGAGTMPTTPGPTMADGSPVSSLQPHDPSAAMQSPTSGAPASGSGGGLLSQGMNMFDKHPGVAQVGGSLLSGLAGGASQQKQIEEMIAAQEWGNMQWQNQSQVGQFQAAAARPITVPSGYLQRAQQVAGLMAGNNGIQPGAPMGPGGSMAPPPTPPALKAPSIQTPTGGMV